MAYSGTYIYTSTLRRSIVGSRGTVVVPPGTRSLHRLWHQFLSLGPQLSLPLVLFGGTEHKSVSF